MIHRVEFEGAARVQLNGLPSTAFDALVERVVALVQEPWDADRMAPGDDPAYRRAAWAPGSCEAGVFECRTEVGHLYALTDVLAALYR